MKRYLMPFCAAALGLLVFAGCKKNKFNLKETTFIDGKASLKVNFFSSFFANPTYKIKVDDVTVSNPLSYATPYPGGGLNTGGGNYADYLAVEPGQRKIKIFLPFVGTNNDSVVLAETTVDLAANKIYSLYYADTAANMYTKLVEDRLSSPDSGFVRYRLINLMPDLATVDLYFGTGSTAATSVKVAGPIAYKDTSAYFDLAINTGTVWSIRPGGAAASTTALASYTSASSVTNQRVYTISTRGYNSITTSTDPRRRLFSFIYNR